jgi:O-antigen ligase
MGGGEDGGRPILRQGVAMPATATRAGARPPFESPREQEARLAVHPPPASRGGTRGGDWPRTTRVLPWAIAAFIAMLFLVPFDAVDLPVAAPVDPKLDRFVLVGLAVVWLLLLLARAPSGPRVRRTPLNWGIFVFLATAGASIAFHADLLAHAEELGLAVKKLALFLAFVLFFYIVASSIRAREVRAFGALIVILATITAIGTTWEFRFGTNYFFDLASKTIGHLVTVQPEPGNPKFGRPNVTGPTGHGLAVTLLLAMALPAAIVGLLSERRTRARYLYAAAAAVILMGCFSTVRKTGVIAPMVAVLVMTAYRPRDMLRLAPYGVAALVLSQLASPGAVSGLRYQFQGGARDSNQGRTSDYAAITPDLKAHLALGRGFGSYDPKVQRFKPIERRVHRTLDNQYLGLAVETGVLGLAAFVAMLACGWAGAHRLARAASLSRAGPAMAAIAGIASFAVASALFDSFSFPQAPYMLFLLCGLAVAAAADPLTERRPF